MYMIFDILEALLEILYRIFGTPGRWNSKFLYHVNVKLLTLSKIHQLEVMPCQNLVR